MKKRFIVTLVMMLMLGVFLVPTKTAAKTVTTKDLLTLDKDMDKVKRGKTYTVKIGYIDEPKFRVDSGWLLFKVPKTKVYTFTVWGVKGKSGKNTFGNLRVINEDAETYYLKTKGVNNKKNERLRVASKFKKDTKKYGDYLKKRSGKTLGKIKKGEILYIGFYMFPEGTQLKLRID